MARGRRSAVVVAGGTLAAVTAVPAVAGPTYRAVDLGACPGNQDSIATDVNNGGQVAGWCYSGQSFTWKNGKMTMLASLGGSYSRASAINDRGEVAGKATNAAGQAHAVVWRRGKVVDLGTLPGGTDSYAQDVNNSGEVAGFSTVSSGSLHAFLVWNGRMIDLGSLPSQSYSIGNGINNRGTVVGYATYDGMNLTPVQWKKGQKAADLGRSFGDASGVATAVNDRGQIVGYGIGGAGNSAFLWDHGRYTNIGRAVAAKLGGTYTEAFAVNSKAQVVGMGETKAFLWDAGKVTQLPGEGGEARGINDAGVIAGDVRVNLAVHATLWVRR